MGKGAGSARHAVQLIAAIVCNSNLHGFINGTIFKGPTKGLCVPGLNCYSCPGAIGACPIGSFQSALSAIRFKLPLYILGMLTLFGVLFGRAICAYLCPFGMIQELLHRVPSPKIKKSLWTRRLSLLKYVVLILFVVALPLYFLFSQGFATPAFCKYICPAGTLLGGIPLVSMNDNLQDIVGALFNWKLFVLAAVITGSVLMYRFFCRFLCPLGAIYSLFNRVAVFGVAVDMEKCNGCMACAHSCKMDARRVNDRECIRCGDCSGRCSKGAIRNCQEISWTIFSKSD